jgi:hypothetical protein
MSVLAPFSFQCPSWDLSPLQPHTDSHPYTTTADVVVVVSVSLLSQLSPCGHHSHSRRLGHHCHCRLTIVTQVVVLSLLLSLLWLSLQWRQHGGSWACAGVGVDAVAYHKWCKSLIYSIQSRYIAKCIQLLYSYYSTLKA